MATTYTNNAGDVLLMLTQAEARALRYELDNAMLTEEDPLSGTVEGAEQCLHVDHILQALCDTSGVALTRQQGKQS